MATESRPSEGDLRRRLEGRVELIESALRRYRRLHRTLASRGWWRALRKDPSLIQGVLEVEPTLLEALERTERRGEQEDWLEGTSIPRTVSRLREVRERLTLRVRGVLLRRSLETESLSLEDGLRKLEEVCSQKVSLKRTPGEPFSLRFDPQDGTPQQLVSLAFFLGLSVLMIGVFLLLVLGEWGLGLVGGGLALVGLVIGKAVLLRRSSLGVVWLTPERLVWMAPGNEPPAAVRLDSLAYDGVLLDGPDGTVCVRGDQFIRLKGFTVAGASRLRVLLELFRDARIRAQAARVDRQVELVSFEARLRRDGTWISGKAVLLGRGVFFLRDFDQGAVLFHAATGRNLLFHFDLELVLEGLSWQPEAELDAYLVRASAATGGAAWSSRDARVAQGTPLEQQIQITRREEVLVGQVNETQLDIAYPLVHQWREAAKASRDDAPLKVGSGS
ncbi:hypothetical protein [Myxococcus qinghaiensis]|uniref:hypothetical protein n=1 Tax=Myxococcus qinghaiensis TaxID=2906758 RepID=UPI0020A778D0|nr:hypothetical protein [Myxococcus qinghaiensis]MCP3166943.1 hypothetical protein [Myxococcus qinghaiensis]